MKPGIPSFLCSCNNFSLASKVTKTGFSMKTLNRRPYYRCQGAWLAPRINQLHSILWYWTQPGRRSQMNTSKGQGICALAVPPLTPPLQSENNTFLPPGALREAYTHTHICASTCLGTCSWCICLPACCSLELVPMRQLQLNFRNSLTKMSLSAHLNV